MVQLFAPPSLKGQQKRRTGMKREREKEEESEWEEERERESVSCSRQQQQHPHGLLARQDIVTVSRFVLLVPSVTWMYQVWPECIKCDLNVPSVICSLWQVNQFTICLCSWFHGMLCPMGVSTSCLLVPFVSYSCPTCVHGINPWYIWCFRCNNHHFVFGNRSLSGES